FTYGQAAELTPGQATFVANITLLGAATAAFGAISGSHDGFGEWQDGTLALGLDGGAVVGAAIAPSLDWSSHRANVVLAWTAIGAIGGGMIAGLVASPSSSNATSHNGDLVSA